MSPTYSADRPATEEETAALADLAATRQARLAAQVDILTEYGDTMPRRMAAKVNEKIVTAAIDFCNAWGQYQAALQSRSIFAAE